MGQSKSAAWVQRLSAATMMENRMEMMELMMQMTMDRMPPTVP